MLEKLRVLKEKARVEWNAFLVYAKRNVGFMIILTLCMIALFMLFVG